MKTSVCRGTGRAESPWGRSRRKTHTNTPNNPPHQARGQQDELHGGRAGWPAVQRTCGPTDRGLMDSCKLEQRRATGCLLRSVTLPTEKLSPPKPKADTEANYPPFSAHERVRAVRPGAVVTRVTGYTLESVPGKDDNIIRSSALRPGVTGRVPPLRAALRLLSSRMWLGPRSRREALGFVQRSDHQVGRGLLWAQLSEAARNLLTSEL